MTPKDAILYSPSLAYVLYFPTQDVLPRITQITYNNRIYCYGPQETRNLFFSETNLNNFKISVSIAGVTNMWVTYMYKIIQVNYEMQSGIPNNVETPCCIVPPQNTSRPTGLVPPKPEITTNRPSFPIFTSPPKPANNRPAAMISPGGTDLYPGLLRPPPENPTNRPTCGIANDVQTAQGQEVTDHEYPWLVAMFYIEKGSYHFRCTATLISDRHAVTGNPGGYRACAHI